MNSNIYRYFFGFSELVFEIQSDHPIIITENFLPFQVEHMEADGIFRISCVGNLNIPGGTLIYRTIGYEVFSDQDGSTVRLFRDHKYQDKLYAVARLNRDGKGSNIYYLPGEEFHFENTNNFFFHTGWESFLAYHRRLLLHASLIKTEMGGILFSGKSGIGKSTQASLWERYYHSQQINGDRPVLFRSEKGWMGSGSPYAGSSDVYENQIIPIRAIILLDQGERCTLHRLSEAEAFRKCFANCTIYSWDSAYVGLVMEMLENLVMEIPVYHLVCTPDREAVESVRNELLLY